MSTQLAEQDAELAAYIDYLANQRKLATLTLENYQRDLQQLNLSRGEQSWSAIRTTDIRKFAAKMHAQGLNPRSIARKLSSWRGFFAWLALQNSLLINPVDGVKAPKRSKPLPKALSVDQAAFLLEDKVATPQAGRGAKPRELLEDGDQTMHACNMAMFELLYSSGLRVSEIVSLDWRYHNQASDWPDYVSAGWVDLNEQMLQVVGKGSKTRLVPVGKLAIAALRRWLQLRPQLARQDASRDAHALFLNQQGRRISSRVLQMRLSKHAQLVGMPSHVHPHVLRHSFASHVLQSSGDLRAVQEMLGHASISSTQVYTALDFQHLAQVYDAAHPRAKKK